MSRIPAVPSPLAGKCLWVAGVDRKQEPPSAQVLVVVKGPKIGAVKSKLDQVAPKIRSSGHVWCLAK